jgi:5-methylcytosine-specific restriction endonuclease McrA
MTRLVSLRRRAAARQSHRCYYCGLPMWEKDPTSFAQTYRLTERQAQLFKCTAEHLHPRSEGGPNSELNIVAACLYCNRRRHAEPNPRSASEYKLFVDAHMKTGRWRAGMLPAADAFGVCRNTTPPVNRR